MLIYRVKMKQDIKEYLKKKNIYLNNNITYSYTPKCFKNLDKGFKKRNLPLNLFFLKGNNSLKRNDTDIILNDIKSYEISLVALPKEDDQEKLKEKKLSNLYHSLLALIIKLNIK